MDFCSELSKDAVLKLLELGVQSTLTKFRYMIQHKKYISNMEEELEKTKALKQTLQGWANAESNKGNEISPNLLEWFSSVASIEKELQNLYENKNTKCFGGECSNLALNYSKGKQADMKAKDITRLNAEGNNLRLIATPKAPPSLGSTFTQNIKSLESRNKTMIDVIEKLKDDRFKRISICGMGGVGKTTLVRELIKSVQNKLFDKVVMAVVSQNPNYDMIQRQIADCLGLVLTKQSVEGRGWEIFEKLKELDDKKVTVLIVLDDVWKELNFELVGLSSQDHQNTIKILLTSRYKKVCQNMGSQENLDVSVLQEDEAWSLFQDMAGDVVNRHDIYPIAREVAKECGGLPLAIVTIARALCEEEKKYSWQDALLQLRKSQSSDMQEYVYSRIELSLNMLSGKEQRPFLFLCGLFPEDFDISVESLLRHGVGLKLFEATDAIWKTIIHVNNLVNNLKKCFLLLDSENQGCAKMHDVVRDVVKNICSREENWIWVQSNAELNQMKQIQGKLFKMSIILDKKIELENDLECPTLELLQVQTQKENMDIISWPENFIDGMTELKVLYIQNLFIPKISSHFHDLINLHTLQLEGCDVGDISVIGKEVKKLEILSFAYSKIKELPAEIGNLGFLKLLDLTGCDYLNFISANVLARLSQLEELYFRVENFPWLLNKEFLKELNKISPQLKVIEIKVRRGEILPNDLIFKNIEKFWVYVVPYDSYERSGYLQSNVLQLKSVDYNSIKSSMMTMQLVKKCEILMLEEVENLKISISELDVDGLQCMEDLSVVSCPNLECVIDCNNSLSAFPLIKSLSLSNLGKMKEIIRAPDHHEITKAMIEFPNLEKLELKFLHKLIGFTNSIYLNQHHQPIHHGLSSTSKLTDSTNIEDGEILYRSSADQNGCRPLSVSAKLFSSNWMKQFPKLEIMVLEECISIKIVFDLEGYSEFNGKTYGFLFPRLRKLEISKMDKLLYVWGNVPCSIQGFHNLRFLTITQCNSLRYVFTHAIVRTITNLEVLVVMDCKMIENIVVWSRDDEVGVNIKGHVKTIEFGKLSNLSISELPKLVSICSNSVGLECSSLKKFNIDGCPMLEISLLPSRIHANQDDLNAKFSMNTKEYDDIDSLKRNNSSSSTCAPVGCTLFLPKFIRQRASKNIINKEASVTQTLEDHIYSSFEMKTKKEKNYMPSLEDLSIQRCDLLDVIFSFKEKTNPSNLETIQIEMCHKLKFIMARREERQDIINYFARLKSLCLKNLPNLLGFCFAGTYESWDKQLQQEKDEHVGDHKSHPFIDGPFFSNLTSLVIESCEKIYILFSQSSLSSLEHLEKLEIRDCKNIKEIVSQEEKEASSNEITLPLLKHIILENLLNLNAFCLSSYNFLFPTLEKLEIEDCPNMEIFSHGSVSTPKLEDVTMKIGSLNVNYMYEKHINATIRGFKAFVLSKGSMLQNEGFRFHELSFLVPFNEIEMLQHVRELEVSYYDLLDEVFESVQREVTKGKKKAIFRPQLQKLTLYHLPCLSHIWKHNITEVASFQNLLQIEVSHCHKLKSLLSHSMARSLVLLEKLSVAHCKMVEEIITKERENIKGGNKVMILFPNLVTLVLQNLPNLECVCSGYYDYDLPFEDDNEIKNNKIQLSMPNLNAMFLVEVQKLKCFCSGAYDYNIMVSSSSEECLNIGTYPHGNVIVKTPNLHEIEWASEHIPTHGDLNLTIHYYQNADKLPESYEVELISNSQTIRNIDEEFLGNLKRVRELCIEKCHKLLNCIPSNMMHIFSHVRDLGVKECENLEEIFDSSDDSKLQCELSRIKLLDLPKLKQIWKLNHSQTLGFKNLYSIKIKHCNDLRYVFSDVTMATSLPQLQYLEVCECKKMEEIIGNNNCEQHQEAKIIFSSLWRIKLQRLPSLKCFCRSSFPSYVELPRLTVLIIKECPKMKTFWFGGILYTPTLYIKSQCKMINMTEKEM